MLEYKDYRGLVEYQDGQLSVRIANAAEEHLPAWKDALRRGKDSIEARGLPAKQILQGLL